MPSLCYHCTCLYLKLASFDKVLFTYCGWIIFCASWYVCVKFSEIACHHVLFNRTNPTTWRWETNTILGWFFVELLFLILDKIFMWIWIFDTPMHVSIVMRLLSIHVHTWNTLKTCKLLHRLTWYVYLKNILIFMF